MQKLIDQLKRHEGSDTLPNGNHRVYRCPAGHLTVGYGRNLEGQGLTESEAEQLLQNDIARSRNELQAAYPWLAAVDPIRQAVLVNLHINMGLPRLCSFVKMLAACAVMDWPTAAAELQDSRWYQQVGVRGPELVEQLRAGRWQS